MTESLVTGVDFVTVFVMDYPAATQFYGNVLGLQLSAEYGKFDGCEYEAGGVTIQVMSSDAIGRPFERSTHPIALRVDDVEAARSELQSRGVEFSRDTIDSGVCHMALFTDPDGNLLMLHHRYAPRAS
jgi:predicted enzyme related to lactoylglutathione lyase